MLGHRSKSPSNATELQFLRVEVTEDFFPFLSAVAEMLEGIMKCLREGSISC